MKHMSQLLASIWASWAVVGFLSLIRAISLLLMAHATIYRKPLLCSRHCITSSKQECTPKAYHVLAPLTLRSWQYKQYA